MTSTSLLILAAASLMAGIIVVPIFFKLKAHAGDVGAMTAAYAERPVEQQAHSWMWIDNLLFGTTTQNYVWGITLDDYGLHLRPQGVFRPIQAGISVPYEDITIRRVWARSGTTIEFHFAKVQSSSVRVSPEQGEKLIAASEGRLTLVDSRAMSYSEILRIRSLAAERERIDS